MSEGLVWSFLLSAIGVTGLFIAGRKNYWGWALNLGAQLLWAIFAIATAQYGFLLSAGAYGWVYWTNFAKWRKEHRDGERASAEGV